MSYGCHNRPPIRDVLTVRKLVQLPARANPGDSHFAYAIGFEEIPNVNSKDCRYDLRSTDPRCAGCRWIKNGVPIDSTIQLKQETLT